SASRRCGSAARAVLSDHLRFSLREHGRASIVQSCPVIGTVGVCRPQSLRTTCRRPRKINTTALRAESTPALADSAGSPPGIVRLARSVLLVQVKLSPGRAVVVPALNCREEKGRTMRIEVGGFLGLLVLIADVWALVNVLGSRSSTGSKVLWT